MSSSCVVPITNVYAKGDFTASVAAGSHGQQLNLVLDSGSSTLVVKAQSFDAASDQMLKGTTSAQSVAYGIGSWAGPVITTQVQMGHSDSQVTLPDVHLALAEEVASGSFAESDGFLGLAYHELNHAYDLSQLVQQHGRSSGLTWPWTLDEWQHDSVQSIASTLHKYPAHTVIPYFSQLERQGVVGNQFGFVIHRSSIYQTGKSGAVALRKHPLNTGLFILGNPLSQSCHYRGETRRVRVVHDKYYNVHLKSMRVGEQQPVAAPELAQDDVRSFVSNAIIDSGASKIMLPQTLFNALFEGIASLDPSLASALETFRTFNGVEKGISMESVRLSEWPDIHFDLEGFDGKCETLTMTPQTYWQTHAPEPGQISFQFVYVPHWPDQAVLGLPLMNNYFTVFDREDHANGAVHFLDKSFEPHRLDDSLHAQDERLRTLFKNNDMPV